MPNPTLIAFPGTTFSSATSFTINSDPGTQIGDLYVLVCYATTGIGVPSGSGWTEIIEFGNDGSLSGDFTAYWKIATVAGGETITVTLASSSGCAAVATIRGAFASFPIANYSYAETTPSDTWTVPSITISDDYTGALVVAISDDHTSQTWSLAPSLSQQMLERQASTSQIMGWYAVQASSGASTSYAATKTGTAGNGAIIAIYIEWEGMSVTGPDGEFPSTGLVGSPYTGPGLVASGGNPPFTYSIAAGGLQPGLSLNPSTGAITGTAIGVEPSQFTGEATDSVGIVRTVDANISIYSIPPPIAPGGPSIIGDLLPQYIGQTTDLDGGEAGGANIQLPPFKYSDGYTYVAYTNILMDGSFRQFLAVGRTNNPNVVPFASVDAAHAPEVSSNAAPCPLIDLANNRILFLVQDGTGDNPPINSAMSVRVFNLTTGLWDTPLATGGPNVCSAGSGPSTWNDWFNLGFRFISPTKFIVVYYQQNANPSISPDLYSVTLTTAGAWGTPQPIVVSSLSPNLYPAFSGMGVDANGQTWVLYYKGTESPLRFNLYFNSISTSGVVGSETLAYTSSSFSPRAATFGTYIPAIDGMIWGFYDGHASSIISPVASTQCCLLIIANVSTSPAFSFEGIADRPGGEGTNVWSSPQFFTSPTGTTWYLGITQQTGSGGPLDFGVESIQLFQRLASGTPGTWTQSTYYDASVNPPAGPVYHNDPDVPTSPAELNSLSFTSIDGVMVTTLGMLSDWCGVIFYLSASSLAVVTIACPAGSGTATVGALFTSNPPVVTGDTPPDSFALLSGPGWMSINTLTGVVSGVPDMPGMVTYVIQVTGSLGNVATTSPGCSIVVSKKPCPPQFFPGSGGTGHAASAGDETGTIILPKFQPGKGGNRFGNK